MAVTAIEEDMMPLEEERLLKQRLTLLTLTDNFHPNLRRRRRRRMNPQNPSIHPFPFPFSHSYHIHLIPPKTHH
jgi:hypothetical protein